MTTMTQEQKREAIARAIGWREVPDKYYCDRRAFITPCGERCASIDIPDYFNSLDAIATAEKWAIDHDYGPLLTQELDGNCFATAALRCEALGRALGLWTAEQEGGV